MRVLDLHADYLEFAVTTGPLPDDAAAPEQPTDPAAEPSDGVPVPREGRLEDCLAAFVGCEGVDAADPSGVADRAAAHLRERAGDLRVDAVAVYPFDHLVGAPADRETAVAVCRALTAALAERGRETDTPGETATLDVLRAPVGWHRQFSVRTTGHPFAESAATFRPGDAGGDSTDRDRTDETAQDLDWVVLTPDGERLGPAEASSALGAATQRCLAELRDGTHSGPGTADTAGASRPATPTERLTEPDGLGGRRVLPAGRLVGDLVADLVRERAIAAGASPVETPRSYDLTDPAVARMAGALGEWVAATDRDGSDPRASSQPLRPSTGLGFLSLLADSAPERVAYPVRVVETGAVAREAPDGTDGQDSQRVPAIHAATADRDAGWSELASLASLGADCLDALGLDVVPVCRAGGAVPTGRLADLAAALDRPVLLAQSAADPVELELRGVIDGQPSRTVAARLALDIAPDTEAIPDGGTLCHCEPVGGIDDVRRALASRVAAGDPLPPWLAPATVRFVPIDDSHRSRATALADRVERAGLRADVDARALPVGARLDGATHLSYVAVVGDREADGGPLGLLDRRAGAERSVVPAALVDVLESAVEGRPRRSRYLPRAVGEGTALRGSDEQEAE
jgi:threonyl-tRNA synthetase